MKTIFAAVLVISVTVIAPAHTERSHKVDPRQEQELGKNKPDWLVQCLKVKAETECYELFSKREQPAPAVQFSNIEESSAVR